MKKLIFSALVFIALHFSIIAQPIPIGCEFDETAYGELPTSAPQTARSYGALPTKASIKAYCPTPGAQKFQDCVGWATTFGARTLLYAKQNGLKDAQSIDDNTFAPSFAYSQVKLHPLCERGTQIWKALDILKEQGAPKSKDLPYECSPLITDVVKRNAAQYKIKDYKTLLKIEDMKKALADGNPVVIGMYVSEGFMKSGEVWNGEQAGEGGGHAMMIVGYDDQKEGGAFEIMNSWGSTWANKGFVWVRYADFFKHAREAYEMIPLEAAATPTTNKEISGELRLVRDNGAVMTPQISTTAQRDFNIVSAENSTYKLVQPYKSGTQFRVYFSNEQNAYVYLIGYGTTTKKISAIFPFDKYSAYMNSRSEVAIPNEDYYIALDENVGTDYLCVLYSTEPLQIQKIVASMQSMSGNFNTRLKTVLKDKMLESANVNFSPSKISFKGATKGKTVVPIVIEFKHI